MIDRSFLISFFAAFLLFFFIACEQENEFDNDRNSESVPALRGDGTASELHAGADTEDNRRNTQMPDHIYLNTIDWELRQPVDLSSATIVTTANSRADRVHFTYHCEGEEEERTSTAIPANGQVSDTLNWDCETLLITEMTAVGTDTTIGYVYTIDIAFLNRLGQ